MFENVKGRRTDAAPRSPISSPVSLGSGVLTTEGGRTVVMPRIFILQNLGQLNMTTERKVKVQSDQWMKSELSNGQGLNCPKGLN